MLRRNRRRAGLLIPLFSCPSSASWGIGEIGDVPPTTTWLAGAGQRILQLLPLNEMAPGQQSPYSALSAMAIDPIYITLADIPEFVVLGGEAALEPSDRDELARVRASPHIDYAAVRALKKRAFSRSFDYFHETEWRHNTSRARDLKAFLAAESWWVDDYALFRALHTRERRRPWTDWPEALQRRDEAALATARQELASDILFRQYLQWIAQAQWLTARAAARDNDVDLFGDLPFMVDGNSADVWAHQSDFRLDASVGVPPDAFSATGQDWGMPPYRWDSIAAGGFRWLRERARRSATLYDGYRIDHLVGFYRTYSRPRDGGAPSFSPATEAEQIRLGEQLLALFRAPGTEVIAEDLGIVPTYVRESLARMQVPGFRVLRWERYWHSDGQPFCDPVDYPVESVAASGTHDTEPMIDWWEHAPDHERRQVAELESVGKIARDVDLLEAPYLPVVRDTLLELLFASTSYVVLAPVQDVFGWRDRINEPATISDRNWTYRLPWPIDHINEHAEAQERQQTLRRWAERYSRLRINWS